MAFKDGNFPSMGSKLTLACLVLISLIYAIMHVTNESHSAPLHKWSLIVCTIIFYVRLVISLFVFIVRKVSWFEGITVGILYGIMVSMFSTWGTKISSTELFWDITGFVLFCIGSFINSLSDYQRFAWKKQDENHGKIYTYGLFHHAMHINYFGDSIMFVGFAIVTQNLMSFIPVVFIILNLIFLQIPQLDDHLKNKYGTDFLEYKRKTKKFIPFIY